MIIDASGLRVGRLATVAAKAALLGKEVVIVNAEKAIITGSKEAILKKYRAQHERGRYTKGPFQPRMPDRFLRRIIRGMLPYRTPRGRDAFRRVMCYIGNPNNEQAEQLKEAHIGNTQITRYLTVKEVCELLGGRQ